MTELVQQGPFAVFAALLVVHCLADFPLQGEYLATHKVWSATGDKSAWIVALGAHCAIHAGGVWLICGSLAFGIAEFLVHGIIDSAKGRGKFGLLTDQLLHLATKGVYACLICWT